MKKVKVGKGVRRTYWLERFIEAMGQQTVFDRVEINEWGEYGDRINVFFYTNYERKEGFYIVGRPIIAEVGSN